MKKHSTYNVKKIGQYRSGLEHTISIALDELGCAYEYETTNIKWDDHVLRSYTPDFILPNGIVIEVKGYFDTQQRRKHIAIQQQYPEIDLRFVFSRSKSKIYKGSKTTYGTWCDKNNFKYADKCIPLAWIKEKAHGR
jgi:hypothetical protein